jgi:iron(III) transport system substrate-binding protein
MGTSFIRRILLLTTILSIMILLPGCNQDNDKSQVVVYTALDQVFSKPILKEFENRTGIKVLPVYDVEATKTTGLVNRLIAESNNPRADVFWNNEFAQIILLKEKGVLTPYNSVSAENIPDEFKDPEHYWTGFAARARVIIVNTELVSESEYPSSIFDLQDIAWEDEAGIANPLFGTTATHAASLFVQLGDEEAKSYFKSLLDNGARVIDGNSVVRDMVVSGELMCGLTDTDDAFVAIEKGEPLKMIFPDQDSIGTLLIPNTVGLIKGAPNLEEAKQFIDYLLSPEVEEALAHASSRQIPLRDGIPTPGDMPMFSEIVRMMVLPQDIAEKMEESSSWLQKYFIK